MPRPLAPFTERDERMIRDILNWFGATYSDQQVALMVTAHAGHAVNRVTIVSIRQQRDGYSGRNLRKAIYALGRAWGYSI